MLDVTLAVDLPLLENEQLVLISSTAGVMPGLRYVLLFIERFVRAHQAWQHRITEQRK